MSFQSNSNQNYINLQESNVKTLSDIQQLQKIEKDLFTNLEQNLSQNTLTDEKKLELISKINEISQMRVNLYQTIKGVNTFHETTLNTATDTLSEQSTAVSIVEKELNEAKKRLDKIEKYKTNKLRLVEINNYYSDYYYEHSKVMKTIIFMFVPILVLTILLNKGLIPNIVFYILVSIIGVIGIVRIYYLVSSMMSRSNMNYQEYNWNFNPDAASTNITTTSKKTRPNFMGLGMCMGEACCDTGYTYDMKKNKCLPTSQIGNDNKDASSFTKYYGDLSSDYNSFFDNSQKKTANSSKEGFHVGQILSKYANIVTNQKPNYTMGDKPQPIFAST